MTKYARSLSLAAVLALMGALNAHAATLFSDDFNRTNNATVSATNWTENLTSTWSVNSNMLRGAGGGVGRAIVTTTSAHSAVADVQVSMTRVANTASFDAGLLCRTNSTATTGYFLDVIGTGAGSTLDVWRIDGPAIGNDTQIGSTVTGLNIPNGSVITFKCETVGATVQLTGYVGGVQRISVTDSSGSRITASGQTGIIQWDSSTNDYDDFLVEDLAAPSSTIVNPLSGAGGGAAQPLTFNLRELPQAANDYEFRLRANR